MAEWKCANCGWTNSGKWLKCAKCGLERMNADMPAEDFHQLEKVLPDYEKLLDQIEQHQIASTPKWEYLQLTSEDLESIGGLAVLGNIGWELVGMSTYSEGGTVLLIGPQIYRIKALYVFKRPRPPLPEDLQRQLDQIGEQLPLRLRARLPLK